MHARAETSSTEREVAPSVPSEGSAPSSSTVISAPSNDLRFPECDQLPFDRREVARLFAIESSGVESPSDLLERTVALDLEECSPESGEVRVTIDLRFERREPIQLVTTVRFADVPADSRARTIAVALAELVRLALGAAAPSVARAEVAPDRASRPRVASSRVSSPAPRALEPAPQLDVFSLAVFGSASALSGELSLFGGGGLDARLRFDSWRVRLGADVARAEGTVALGRVGVTATSLAAGVEYVVVDAPRLTLGPTLRGTWLRAAGVSKRGVEEGAVDETALTLSARAGVEARLVGPWSLLLAAELGCALRTVEFTGGGAPLVGVSGAVGRLELGIVTTFEDDDSR